ncbi:uncharacterized protein LOC132549608 [Ylistrum balloti]|uniref:uncharacterized protein LOC132549608 n=1 Tax=Ylistrum balloti TaxID=509963 RepID=UPI002905DDC5|nr:uncharacterized protein LOC132549608 [Ylistrum balloti]
MSVEPHIQEIPPDYQEVVAEDQSENKATDRTDNVNVGFEPDIDRIEVAVESTEGSKKGGITGKTTPAASSVIPSSSTSEKKASNIQGMETLTTQEEKMLSVLRDVAQKCTNANPLKRPTAEQVLKMLQAINPYPDDYDDDDVDDDDADDGDDVEMKYKVEDVAVTKIRNEIALVTS